MSASANSSSAATVDVTAPVNGGQTESLANGDPRFRELFANWTALDGRSAADNPADFRFERPVVSLPSRQPLLGATMTSGFGMRRHPVLGGARQHSGIDLAAPTGTPVYATADGMISRADWFAAYGLTIDIDHSADTKTRYAHLSRLAVAAGEPVKKGDLIGYVGSTGRSTGPHLHYEVRIGGVAVNPIPYMVESEAELAYARDARLTGRGGN
jgi:murein DD-endopeptidase MepM/ murein hydrolase activator NlpD